MFVFELGNEDEHHSFPALSRFFKSINDSFDIE